LCFALVTTLPALASIALATLTTLVTSACAPRPPCDGVTCAAACPRDAEPDRSGRCACIPGDVLVLGACVPPAVGDAYCGPAARAGAQGCVFRTCASGELLDAVTGLCTPALSVAGETADSAQAVACGDAGVPAVAEGRAACVSADVACPRGTRRIGGVCARAASCPPGSLPVGPAALSGGGGAATCRPVVTVGARSELRRVDIGAWAAIVLGVDGGPGTPDLCRPLALRRGELGLPRGVPGSIAVRIALLAPDQDMTRVRAQVVEAQLRQDLAGQNPGLLRGEGAAGGSDPRSLQAGASALVERTVETLVEPLRSLGGEASAAVFDVGVTCRLGASL
jgi:hypothetical protein